MFPVAQSKDKSLILIITLFIKLIDVQEGYICENYTSKLFYRNTYS